MQVSDLKKLTVSHLKQAFESAKLIHKKDPTFWAYKQEIINLIGKLDFNEAARLRGQMSIASTNSRFGTKPPVRPGGGFVSGENESIEKKKELEDSKNPAADDEEKDNTEPMSNESNNEDKDKEDENVAKQQEILEQSSDENLIQEEVAANEKTGHEMADIILNTSDKDLLDNNTASELRELGISLSIEIPASYRAKPQIIKHIKESLTKEA